MRSSVRQLLPLACLISVITTPLVEAEVVFTNSFDGTLPAEIVAGVATLTGVQGYAGLGRAGNQFGGSFLRSPTGNTVTLILSNLPPHTVLNVSMLFAAIDSLDGTGTFPSGDFFTVTLDTNVVFRESFANALPSQTQSYVPPPGAELARHLDLGFSGPGGYYTDSAYDFGVDPRFSNLDHTNSVAVLTFLIEGPGIQDINDESWAMDNLGISAELFSRPVLTQILTQETNTTITWTAVSNIIYRVQTKTNLSEVAWNDQLPLVTATNAIASYSELREPGNKFYRVMVVP